MKDEQPKDLRVRTKCFALDVVRLYSALPKTTAALVLGRQVLRSGTSVGANYREAYRARSKTEMITIQGECNELLAILTTISKRSKATLS